MNDDRAYHQELLGRLRHGLAGNAQPIKMKKKTASNLFRYEGRRHSAARKVDLSAFDRPLYLDETEGTLEVQGLATYETIVRYTLEHGFLPTIAPGLKHITVAGAIVGIGIESNCARYGFAHDGLLEADVLLPDGTIVTCTRRNGYADLLRGLPNSYGTLGYILRAKIALRRAKPYVSLDTRIYTDVTALLAAMEAATHDAGIDYIESLLYDKERMYLTLGRQTDKGGPLLSIYGKTRFYKEISRPGKLLLAAEQYIFRYDPEWFWALPESQVLDSFRRWAPPRLRNSGFYRPFMYAKAARYIPALRPKPDFELLIQDWEVPWGQAAELCEFALDTVDIAGRPWLCGPIVSPGRADLYPIKPNELYLNLGCYTAARKIKDKPYENTKVMDAYCFAHKGIKMLYSTSFMTPEEFAGRYNGRTYDKLKAKYDPAGLAPSLYQKTVEAS